MLASTIVRPPVEAGLWVPELSATDSFDTICSHVELVLIEVGATHEIIDPAVDMLEESWNPSIQGRTAASRHNVLEAIRSIPDVVASAEAIQWVTGKYTDKTKAVIADLMHDVGKPELEEENKHSQAGLSWPMEKRWKFMPHVLIGKEIIEASSLPEYYNGEPFKQYIADVVGETHSIQPDPSYEYGCGHRLGRKARRTLGAVAPPDWYGAKFDRVNAGNLDKDGNPLPDYVRAQQFAYSLGYHFGDFWHVSDHNNPVSMAQAVFYRFQENHPNRLTDVDPAIFSMGAAARALRGRNYLKLSFNAPRNSLEPRSVQVTPESDSYTDMYSQAA